MLCTHLTLRSNRASRYEFCTFTINNPSPQVTLPQECTHFTPLLPPPPPEDSTPAATAAPAPTMTRGRTSIRQRLRLTQPQFRTMYWRRRPHAANSSNEKWSTGFVGRACWGRSKLIKLPSSASAIYLFPTANCDAVLCSHIFQFSGMPKWTRAVAALVLLFQPSSSSTPDCQEASIVVLQPSQSLMEDVNGTLFEYDILCPSSADRRGLQLSVRFPRWL
jgi:hypothetical protein